MGYERPYYEDLNYRPYVYYVVFGVDGTELELSRERHHIDEFPEGLELFKLQKPENAEYMDLMIGGAYGRVLASSSPELYSEICRQDKWAVIQGEVKKDRDLHYMRNIIGVLQALSEKGATGILDLQTITLYRPGEWTERMFLPEFAPSSHVSILSSQLRDGSLWLHTRGMRKFGRPDISMEQVGSSDVENACRVINQMIFYGALGAFFSGTVKLHAYGGLTCIAEPEYIGDMENTEFNNAYYRVLWPECKLGWEEEQE